MRGATSQDGTGFWASGTSNGGGSTGGVWWIPFGGASPVRVLATPTQHPLAASSSAASSTSRRSSDGALRPGHGRHRPADHRRPDHQRVAAGPARPPNARQPLSATCSSIGRERRGRRHGCTSPTARRASRSGTLATTGGIWTPRDHLHHRRPANGFRGRHRVRDRRGRHADRNDHAEVGGTRIVRYVDTGTGTPSGHGHRHRAGRHGLPRRRVVAAPVSGRRRIAQV